MPSAGSPRMEDLSTTARNCPRTRSRRRWRTGAVDPGRRLQPGQPPYASWPEDNEKPYYTEKPDWDAFGAMLLVAACHTYGQPVPATVEKDWDFMEHPLIARLGKVRSGCGPCSGGPHGGLPPRR